MTLTEEAYAHGLFEASHPFLFFDYFRIPYRRQVHGYHTPAQPSEDLLSHCATLHCPANPSPPRLYWPPITSQMWPASYLSRASVFSLENMPFYGKLVRDSLAHRHLASRGWERTSNIHDMNGQVAGSLWQDVRGNVFLPFDPSEVIRNYWAERYRSNGSPTLLRTARCAALRSYYRLRPMLPRPLQIRMRRAFTRLQLRTRFPGWPMETALHDLYALLFQRVAELAACSVPWISPWPKPYSWAFILTHDVETAAGLEGLPRLRELEVNAGYRSSWNFVPKRYDVPDSLVDSLLEDGFEVGVHGLYHDGRDLESLPLLTQRLPEMRQYAERWRATGFRSPATLRVWEWMPLLGFDYDSSFPDSDVFEPQPGGCCTWLPYFNRDLVELPITVPQDHTLFVILNHQDETVWTSKIDKLRRLGGMALIITHPDYLSGGPAMKAYSTLLNRYRDDPSAWRALPRDVSGWWRRRAASRLERADEGWRIVGPAALEGQINFTERLSTGAAASHD